MRHPTRSVPWLLVTALVTDCANAIRLESVNGGDAGSAGRLSRMGVGGSGLRRICGAVAALVCVAVIGLLAGTASADTFGTGANQFTIDFVPIPGATNPSSGIPAGEGFTFTGVQNDYRMGTYDITNDQWNKFKASLGVPVTGGEPSSISGAYSQEPYFAGLNMPTNNVSWVEAAQFVNWLNTSTGHQAAYRFIGTQGTLDYTFATWSAAEADNGTNLYRHKDAKYYLPSEGEWVKAAYWNGTALQFYATQPGDTVYQGNGTNGGWNYYNNRSATNPTGPWNVGSGSEELNGTYDVMGNVWQWMESSHYSGNYSPTSARGLRGGSFNFSDYSCASYTRYYSFGTFVEHPDVGFRVASDVPEPATVLMLALAGVAVSRKQVPPRTHRRASKTKGRSQFCSARQMMRLVGSVGGSQR